MKKNYIFTLLLAFCFSNLSFGQEMLLNGDFENWDDDTTPTSWTKVENTTKESTEIHGGSFSAKHVGGTKDLGQTIEGVIAGNSYTMTLWYKVTGGDDTNARIWSYWKNAEGGSVTDAATDASLRGPSNGYLDNNGGVWTKYEVTVIAPAEVTKLYFELRTYGSATVYYDDLSFVNNTVVSNQVVLEDFEGTAPTVAGFEGLASATVSAGPVDSANTALELITSTTGQGWQGAELIMQSNLIDLSTDNTVKIDVYSTTAFTMFAKVEDKVNATASAASAADEAHTGSGWETLTFTFNEALDNTAAANGQYSQVAFFPNWSGSGWNDPIIDITVNIDNVTANAGDAIGGGSDSDYCEKVVSHLGIASGQEASEIKLTVVNSGEKTMKVTIESNNEDAVDFMLIPGDVTGSPTQSAVDESVAGKMSITLTWAETAPTDVALNILWSKVSTEGNWQLGDAPTTFKFDATCATASIDDKLLVSFSMYPNPASSSLNISASSMIKNAVIYNILGKQVMNLSINKNNESINVSNLASGMYLIKYTTESAVGTAKFIKQ